MQLKVGNKISVNIYDEVILNVLNIYPEEGLSQRPFFTEGFASKHISYRSLLHECEIIYIPWQMFFLTPDNLKGQLKHIYSCRKYKFSPKFFSKRSGIGKVTSKRIIDRLVGLQNYIINNYNLPKNSFCGALRGKSLIQCVDNFVNFFDINRNDLQCKNFERALDYLIKKIGAKNINISRGVWKGGILPEVKNINSVYKNTSGFVLKDERIPFIFLPDEINPDEAIGRRIYTLIYLIVCIGLDEYDFYLESNFKANALKKSGLEAKKHEIVSAILLPEEETEKLRASHIDNAVISRLASVYKITPTAVVVTLKRRGLIDRKEYEILLPPPYKSKKVNIPRKRPKIITAVKKFCGSQAFDYVNHGIKNKNIKSIEAQYLIFGRVNKKQFKEYCSQMSL